MNIRNAVKSVILQSAQDFRFSQIENVVLGDLELIVFSIWKKTFFKVLCVLLNELNKQRWLY